MFSPLCIYVVSKRVDCSVLDPSIPFVPIVNWADLIEHASFGGVAFFNQACEPVANIEQACYVVHPETIPSPPGFAVFSQRQRHENQTAAWEATAQMVQDMVYSPLPVAPTPAFSSFVVQPPTEEAEVDANQQELIETAEGYALISPKSRRQIRASNFRITDLTVIHYLKDGADFDEQAIRLNILVISGPSHRVVESLDLSKDELDSVGLKIGKKVGTAISYPRAKQSFWGKLSVLVRERLAYCSHHYVYRSSGWVLTPQNQWIYVQDGAKPPNENIRFQCGFRFGIPKPDYTTEWLVGNAWRLLHLSPREPAASLIPFLFAHLSLLWSLFEAAGYPPHVLLFIKGTTGSLKTAVASLLFNFSSDPKNNIPATFRDTSASMEVKMGIYRDRVLLADDFCPAASENSRRVLEQNLEQLVRFYGDGIAKARTNPKLEETYEKRPHGLCVITGEDSAGSYSSLLRCLFVSVTPDTYNKELLAEFQRAPSLWIGYLDRFVSFCCDYASQIIDLIREQFPILRKQAEAVITERRLVDAFADLCLAGKILLEFVSRPLGLTGESQNSILNQMEATILEVCRRSAEESKDSDPVKVFSRYLLEGVEKQAIRLVSRREFELSPEKFDGYEENGLWHFRGNTLFSYIRKEYSGTGKQFPLTEKRLWEELYLSNILIPAASREEAGAKFEYGVKASFGARSRYIRIDPSALGKYL